MKFFKLVLAVVIACLLNVYPANAMRKGWYIKGDDITFVDALNRGDDGAVKLALSEDRNLANKKFKSPMHHMTAASPIEIVLDGPLSVQEKHVIFDILLAHGADKNDLNQYLKRAANDNNIDEVKWIISKGIKDIDGSALKAAKEVKASFRPRERGEIAKSEEIIQILEKNK